MSSLGLRWIDSKDRSVHGVDRPLARGSIGVPIGREGGLLLHIYVAGLDPQIVIDLFLELVLELI